MHESGEGRGQRGFAALASEVLQAASEQKVASPKQPQQGRDMQEAWGGAVVCGYGEPMPSLERTDEQVFF